MTTQPPSVWTVGHDGSDSASGAVRWAVTQATGRDVEITVIRTWQIPAIDFPLPVESIDEFAPSAVCPDIDVITASANDAGVRLSQSILRGPATHVLLDESKGSELLIVGSRGLGGFRRLLLGSISSQCATHARVPTVVVPPAAVTDRPVRRIVVGLDGSEHSQRALAWAIDFAPEPCEIVVVGAWMPSTFGYVAVAQHYTDELQQARNHFNEILDAREADAGSTLFERRFAYADPATTLLEEAERADLLIVGQRGHSGLSAAILGSVSTHVLHHSPVPVVIVPESD